MMHIDGKRWDTSLNVPRGDLEALYRAIKSG